MRHPPWDGKPGSGTAEFLTREGAHRLKGMIEAAWRRAGYDVRAEVIEAFQTSHGSIHSVRMPTLVNGLPT